MSDTKPSDTSFLKIQNLITQNFKKVVIPSDTTNLIECGMDSIKIMKLVSILRKAKIKVTFQELIMEPTLKAWASKIAAKSSKATQTLKATEAPSTTSNPKAQEGNTTQSTESPYDLTDVQYAYWVGREDNQELGGVGCHAYLEITGSLINEKRLDSAFQKLIARHSMLRTRFTKDGKQVNLRDNHNEPLKVHDFSEKTPEEAEKIALEIRERNSHRKLAIEKGQVIGLELLKYPDGTSTIFFDVDLLVSDVQSLNILLHDLAALYQGKDIKAPLNWSFKNYLEKFHTEGASHLETSQKYWEERLPTLPMGPELPYLTLSLKKPHFVRRKHVIPSAIWNTLKERALKEGLTPAMTLATAYSLLLSRYSSSKNFLINVPLFNRDTSNPELEHVVSDFTNLLLLECDFREDRTFKEQAKSLQSRFHQDSAYTDYSAIKVLRDLGKLNSYSSLIAPVVFACNLGTELIDKEVSESFGNLSYMISQTPQVSLDHQIYEMPEGLMVCFDAVEDLFPKGFLDSLFKSYIKLLEELGTQENSFEKHYLTGLSEEEAKARALVNATEGPISDTDLIERIFAFAKENPHKVALYYGDNEITFEKLTLSALRIGSLLKAQGVKPQDRVAVSVARGPLQIISVLGVLATGAIYVPISVIQPEARKNKILGRAEIKFVLTSEPFQVDDNLKVTLLDPMEASNFEPLPEPLKVNPDNPAYIIFTSGSTGEPKGVEISHRGAMNTILDITRRASLTSESTAFAISAMDFDLSVFDVFGLLGVGGALVVIDEEDRRDAELWLDLVHEHNVTVWNSVPVLLDMLLIASENDTRALPLKTVMLSGDWIGLDLPERLNKACQGNFPLFMAMGGATEGSIWSNLYTVTLPLDPSLKSIPYGYPLTNQLYRVVDSLGQDCPDYVPGELLIGGLGVALGYANAPEITKERFFSENGTRWYHTGDQGRYLPGGLLEFLGRKDHQVKVRGHRIELGEIEAALTSLKGITRAIAVTLGKPPKLAVALEREANSHLDAEEVKLKLGALVPDYMVPNLIKFYEALPLSLNGKIDRKAILNDLKSLKTEDTFEAPVCTIENQVASVWAKILKLPKVSRNDNFFEVGGDSLLATQVISELEKLSLTSEAPLKALFESPRLKDFAGTLSQGKLEELFTIKEDPENRFKPFPLNEVQRAYFLGQMEALALNSKTYYLIEVTGPKLEEERLNKALDLLVARHEMLRSEVLEDGTQVILEKATKAPVTFFFGENESEIKALKDSWWQKLNLDSQSYPFAVGAFTLENTTRLSLAFNYMHLDGFSVKLLLKELGEAYLNPESYAERKPLTLSFRDYILSETKNPDKLKKAETYWNSQIESLPNAPELPLTVSPDTVKDSHFKRLSYTLKTPDWEKLKQKSQKAGLTPSSVLLTAYAMVLSRYSSEPSLTINMTLFDRKPVHPEINAVVGDFTSLLPISYHPALEDTFIKAAKKVQGELASGLDHRELSSIYIQRELSKRKGLSMASLPVIFTSTLGVGTEALQEIPDNFLKLTEGGLSETPQVWLDHQLFEKEDGVYLTWDYVEELFLRDTVDEMFKVYQDLVKEIVSSSWDEILLPKLPKATLETRKAINATESEVSNLLLSERIFSNARKNPDAIALYYGDNEITYGKLLVSVLRIASFLKEAGVKALNRVAVSVPRGPLQIISVLAVHAVGGVYVPISVTQPLARKKKILTKAAIKFVLTEENYEFSEELGVKCLDPMKASSYPELSETIKVNPDSPAYIIFTSGSTGEPKGVEISHRGAMNTILDITERAHIDSSSTAMAISAMDFDLSVFDVFGLLGAEGSLVVIDEEERRDAALWLDLVHEHQVTIWNSVPVLLDMLLIASENDSRPLPLKAVMLSGDWISLDIPERLNKACGGILPYFMAMGGATEGSIWSNLFEVTLPLDPTWKSIPYGYPLRNQYYRVVDSLGRDTPNLVPGELLIGGTGVALGYANAPEITRERFFTQDGIRWYHTGDQGRYLKNGCLEFLGRKDHQVKVRGHRIELGEIEAALTSLTGINKAIAVTVGKPPKLAVALEKDPALTLTSEEVKAKLSVLVPEYMVPNHIEFYETLPLSANGKIDRKTIIGELSNLQSQEHYEAPEGPIEIQVAEIWQDLLKLPKVSRNDDFFLIGGDSLTATQVITALEKVALTAEAPLKALFRNPKLKDFSKCLKEGHGKTLFTVKEDLENRYQPFPLTEVQRAYWMGQAPGLPLNSKTYYLVEMGGALLDFDRLENALNLVIQRHELLRTHITGEGEQVILREEPCLKILPLTLTSLEEANQALKDWWQELNESAESYPYALKAFIYGDNQLKLDFAFNYMNLDGFSIKLILKEISEAYQDAKTYQKLAPIGISFRDYILSKPEDKEALKKAHDYWESKLETLPPAPELPTLTSPDKIKVSHFVREASFVSPENFKLLKAKAKAHGLTSSQVLLHAYGEVLARYSGSLGVTINMTLFDRANVHPDIYKVAGDFTSLVPVAYRPDPKKSFKDVTKDLSEELASALDHRELSSIYIQRELSKRKGLSMASLPVVFTSNLGISDNLLDSDKEDFLTILDGGLSETPQVWLDHQLYEKNQGLYLSWDYVSELYDSALIKEMFGVYLDLIKKIIKEDWDKPIASSLPLTTLKVRKEVNATQGEITDLLLTDRIFAKGLETPEAVALYYGDNEVTYKKLLASTLRIAGMLQAKGVKAQDRVAVSVARGPLQIISVLAVLALGAVYVPISVTQPEVRKNKIISRAGIHYVLTNAPFTLEPELSVTFLDPMEASDYEALKNPVKVDPDSPAYIIFTSGSTGEPKGVEISHRGAMNTILDITERAHIDSTSTAMAISAMDFDLSVFDVFGLLGAGGSLVVIDEEERRDAALWLDLVHEHKVTIWNSVPVLLDMLLVASESDSRPLPLKAVMLSGDWIGLDLPERLSKACGSLPYFMAMGGATEGSIWSNLYEVTLPLAPNLKSIPYGYPLRNQLYRVVDSVGRDCPDLVPGELLIGGLGVALGYANAPEITQERFFTEDGIRWYHTGDQGRYLKNGCLEFLGRKDHQVKVRGHRIELGEIEAALTSLSGVNRAVALTLGKPPKLAVALERVAGSTLTSEDLRAQLSALVPEYMVPHIVEFYDALPLSANGKIDRKKLISDLGKKTTEIKAEDLPKTDLENKIADIWKDLLKLDTVSRHDDFFSSGGDSLSATKFVETLREENITVSPLPLRALFGAPTVAEISTYIEENNLQELNQQDNAFEEGTL